MFFEVVSHILAKVINEENIMSASEVVALLRNRKPFNQEVAKFGGSKPLAKETFPTQKILQILDENAEKIDLALTHAIEEKKNFITLASWADHFESDGVLGEEFDELDVLDDYAGLHASRFSPDFTEHVLDIIARWVSARYQGEARFSDASDGCNDAWTINFLKPGEMIQG